MYRDFGVNPVNLTKPCMTLPLRVALDRAERRARQIARQCRESKISK